MTVLAGAAQERKKPPTFSFITISFLHLLHRMQKSLTATNQKVGGSNPFWRTTFSCGKQAISSEIACFFTFLEFAKICANKIANIKFLRFLCKQRFKHPFSFPDPLAEFASV